MKDDSHPREAILKHAKVITIRLTTLFWLCLIASLCDFPNVCLSDYRVVCRSLCVTVHRLLFIFFVLLTAQLTYWLTVLLSLCVTWYLSVFVLLQILNVLTVVKWHSLPLIVSYLVSFRLLLRILTGCHLLMHSKFILWNDLFLTSPPPLPFPRASSCGALTRQSEVGNKLLWMISSTLCDVIHLKKADITGLLDKRHSAQWEVVAVQIPAGPTLRAFNWVENAAFVKTSANG